MKTSRDLSKLGIIYSVAFCLLWISCSKNEPSATLPKVTTSVISSITQTTATGGGHVTAGGGLAIIVRGVCWNTSPSPTIESNKTNDGTGLGSFTSNLTGLLPNTSYFVRAYATNSLGTGYGNEQTFTTLPDIPGTVTDIDGNVYHTVIIASQEWMKENLKVVRYNKGDSIPNVPDGLEWMNVKKGAYCDYDKNPSISSIYGRLYNWYAVADTRNICPLGWHVPSDTEWQTLIDFLGGAVIAGGKLKATGTLGQGNGLWQDPNTGATNESGFSALPAGFRNMDGTFSLLSYNACFWTSTLYQTTAWNRELSFKYENVDRFSRNPSNGYSIRCIKDK